MSKFVETLNEILQDKNISLLSFSKSVGIPYNTLRNLKLYNPTINNAILIADYFSTSLDYFERRTDKFEYNYNKNYELQFYSNLRKLMNFNKIKKITLCNDLGISHSTIDRWATGILPTYSNLITIAQYLDCSIDKLLGRI